MFKKLLVLALVYGFSLSASASFVEYDLNDVKFDDGTSLAGFFVQDTDRNTIAFYDMNGPGNAYFADQYTQLLSTNGTAANGPLDFDLSSHEDMDFASMLALVFSAGGASGTFMVGGFEHTTWTAPPAGAVVTEWQRNIVSGSVAVGKIDPNLLASLQREAGAAVSEPASLALVAAGMCAFGCLPRRAKRAAG